MYVTFLFCHFFSFLLLFYLSCKIIPYTSDYLYSDLYRSAEGSGNKFVLVFTQKIKLNIRRICKEKKLEMPCSKVLPRVFSFVSFVTGKVLPNLNILTENINCEAKDEHVRE